MDYTQVKARLARINTTCKGCGGPIQAGRTWYVWERRIPGQNYHAECYAWKQSGQIDTTPPRRNEFNQTEGEQANGAAVADVTKAWAETERVEAEKPANGNGAAAVAGADGLASIIAAAVAPMVEDKVRGKVNEDDVRRIVEENVNAAFEANLQAIREAMTREVVIKDADGAELARVENPHKQFTKLLKLVQRRKNVYMYGDAGWGKSYAAQQVSEALGLAFYYISLNNQSPAYRLEGFLAADGQTFSNPDFFKAYRDGGVFLIDEIDAANGNLLTSLNSALMNGKASFPVGIVDKHPDFVCVATGNTSGRGASMVYNSRMALDGATLERFIFLHWGEDEELETKLTLARNPKAKQWVKWVQTTRRYCKTNFPKLIVSPRASYNGAELLSESEFTREELADMVLFKGMEPDSVRKILTACPLPS